MGKGTDTRLVECNDCGEPAAYAELPAGSMMVTDGVTDNSVRTTCLECGNEFLVYYE